MIYNLHMIMYITGDRSMLDPITLDKRVTEWKFSSLDIDKNGTLSKVEYRDLKRLVRKVVRPKRCSRTFIRTCDTDHNSIVSKIEWTNCLSIDGRPSLIYHYTFHVYSLR